MSWVVKGLIAGAAGIGLYALIRFARAAGKIAAETKARIHSLDFSKIIIGIDTTLKNPSGKEIVFKYPFISLIYKGEVIATSELKNETIRVAPHTQTPVNDIRIPVSYLRIASLVPVVLRKLVDSSVKIDLQAKVETTVITGLASIAYSTTENLSV